MDPIYIPFEPRLKPWLMEDGADCKHTSQNYKEACNLKPSQNTQKLAHACRVCLGSLCNMLLLLKTYPTPKIIFPKTKQSSMLFCKLAGYKIRE